MESLGSQVEPPQAGQVKQVKQVKHVTAGHSNESEGPSEWVILIAILRREAALTASAIAARSRALVRGFRVSGLG